MTELLLPGDDEYDDGLDWLRKVENWSPEAKARAAAELARLKNIDVVHWYCDRVPHYEYDERYGINQLVGCDGKPHGEYDYDHARAKQWPPPGSAWFLWLIMSGRGFGKTRTAAEWIRKISHRVGRIALVGRRGPDVRQTMIEGEGGLIYVCERAHVGYDWQPSKKEFTFLDSGAVCYGYSAEEPATLRGPQHAAAWLDEPSHFDLLEDVWENLLYGLRLPGLPGGVKVIATSTPLPSDWIDEQIADEDTRMTRGSSYENESNLDRAYKKRVLDPRKGTRLGQQEIYGEVLRDTPGALWMQDWFQPSKLRNGDMDRIIVGIDPAGSTGEKSDQTGIVAAGRVDNELHALEDVSGKYSPDGWANAALDLYEKLGADAIVAEKNFGGDMVKTTLGHAMEKRGITARIIITNASRSKKVRAEPIAALYEQQRAKHRAGLADLETEMTKWVPGKTSKSPNRIDAYVWAGTELMKLGSGEIVVSKPRGNLPRGGSPRGLRGRNPWSR